jgi:hypothetical protein
VLSFTPRSIYPRGNNPGTHRIGGGEKRKNIRTKQEHETKKENEYRVEREERRGRTRTRKEENGWRKI